MSQLKELLWTASVLKAVKIAAAPIWNTVTHCTLYGISLYNNYFSFWYVCYNSFIRKTNLCIYEIWMIYFNILEYCIINVFS